MGLLRWWRRPKFLHKLESAVSLQVEYTQELQYEEKKVQSVLKKLAKFKKRKYDVADDQSKEAILEEYALEVEKLLSYYNYMLGEVNDAFMIIEEIEKIELKILDELVIIVYQRDPTQLSIARKQSEKARQKDGVEFRRLMQDFVDPLNQFILFVLDPMSFPLPNQHINGLSPKEIGGYLVNSVNQLSEEIEVIKNRTEALFANLEVKIDKAVLIGLAQYARDLLTLEKINSTVLREITQMQEGFVQEFRSHFTSEDARFFIEKVEKIGHIRESDTEFLYHVKEVTHARAARNWANEKKNLVKHLKQDDFKALQETLRKYYQNS
jgi:hypothetical protein